MNSIVKDAKQKLRTHIKQELSRLSHSNIVNQSDLIFEYLSGFERFQRAKSIAVYMNMPVEVHTMKIIEQCFNGNKKVYLPKCYYEKIGSRKINHLNMIKIENYEEVKNLQAQGKFRLLEPHHKANNFDNHEKLDIIIVPGVAFNEEKKRIGHGAGFYDEYLSTYYQQFGEHPFLIGIGLNDQLVHQLPVEEHDWSLDCIITPKGIIS